MQPQQIFLLVGNRSKILGDPGRAIPAGSITCPSSLKQPPPAPTLLRTPSSTTHPLRSCPSISHGRGHVPTGHFQSPLTPVELFYGQRCHRRPTPNSTSRRHSRRHVAKPAPPPPLQLLPLLGWTNPRADASLKIFVVKNGSFGLFLVLVVGLDPFFSILLGLIF
jgi:hypothetical protein